MKKEKREKERKRKIINPSEEKNSRGVINVIWLNRHMLSKKKEAKKNIFTYSS